MSYAIGSQCTACGVCTSTCPNQAIRGLYPRYYIEPLLCTECVLYAGAPQCVEACPDHAIVECELRPGQRWTENVPSGVVHPALRKTRLRE